MKDRNFHKAKWTILGTVAAAAVSGVALSLIVFTSGITEGGNNIGAYLIAATFWLSILAVIVFSFSTRRLLNKHYKELMRKQKIAQRVPGVLHFSLKMPNIVIYAVTVVGVILMVTDIIFGYIAEAIMFPVVSITLVAFILHCVIDGKYYKVYQYMKGESKK